MVAGKAELALQAAYEWQSVENAELRAIVRRIHEQRYKDPHTFKAAVLQRVQPCMLQQLRQQWYIGAAQPGGYSLRHLPPEVLTRVLRRVVCPEPYKAIDGTSDACLYAGLGASTLNTFYSKAVYSCRQVCKLFEAEALSFLETIHVTSTSKHSFGFPGFCDLAVERMALAPALQSAHITFGDKSSTDQLNPATLACMLPACRRLHELRISGKTNTPLPACMPACVAEALSGCTALRFLQLDNLALDAASSAAFEAALQGLPALHTLRLSRISLTSNALPFETLTTLQNVVLQYLPSVVWQDFLRLPNLRRLLATSCMSRTLPASQTICSGLEYLCISYVDFADIPLRALSTLRRLDAAGCDSTQVEALSAVLRAPLALDSLSLFSPPLELLQATTSLNDLTCLMLFDLGDAALPWDVAEVLPCLPALKDLQLSRCAWGSTDTKPLFFALPGCRHLTRLELATQVDDESVGYLASAILQGAPLRELDLRRATLSRTAAATCAGLTRLLSVKL